MPNIEAIIIEADEPELVSTFYAEALRLGDRVHVRASHESTAGFRGWTLSLIAAQPADVDAICDAAMAAGAATLQEPTRSLWGYGASLRAPDGTIVTVASASKKDAGPASRDVTSLVLQLGSADVKAAGRSLADHGLEPTRSFGGKYAEYAESPAGISLALTARKILAKNAHVDADGTGSHRVAIAWDGPARTDADGFVWQSAAA